MSFATSTRNSAAGQPPAQRQTSRHRRGCAACCVAAAAALALSVSLASPTRRVSAPAPSPVAASPTGRVSAAASPLVAAHPRPEPVAGSAVLVAPMRALAKRAPSVHSRRVCVRLANVRSGPGLSYRVVTTARRGTRVRGTTSHGWLRIRAGRWIAYSLTCGGTAPQRSGGGAGAPDSFRAWVRVIDPAGNASWSLDRAGHHTRGVIRGLTVFRGDGPTRSTVYIQPGMSWSKTKMVMAHESIHVRQMRYGGFAHSLRAFGGINGLERSADCGASMILHQQVRAGCRASDVAKVRRLLAGRPA